ncbi:TadE/TadG family type IV pilus assembly protein, partial [Alkalihalobacillus pseudalcaliphilus]|uniref:TadE/TadG family type IV pilus assembly protein n=1 Tax=Alkalihalobacillus pseudalcaliphilus TaxID=79884 RepID=UPI003B5C8435
MKKWLKKAYHKFIFDEKGAVSIYAIMITLLLFLFNAVLIDYMRIMVAERETEQAARAAARSVMANFDHGVKTYGLFGVKGGQEEANEIFQTVFEKHLEVDGSSGDIFHFSTPQPVEGSVNVVVDEDRMLAHSEMFKHQVLEEMKYSAPIEVGQALIEGVLGISSAMEEASKLSKVHKKIKDDLDGREQKLDEALAKLEEAREKMANLASKVNANGNSTFPTVNRTGDIVRHYQTYNDNKAELQEELDEDASDEDKEKRDKMRQDNEDFLRDANELAEDIYEDVIEIGELLDEVLDLLTQARVHNENINTELEGADEDVDFSDAISVGESGGSGSADFGGAEEGIGEARDELNKLAVDDSVFEEIISLVESGKRAVDDGQNQGTSAMRSKIFAVGTMINEGLQPHSQQRNWFSNAVNDLASAHSTGTTHLNDAHEKLKDLIEELKSTDTKSSDEVDEKEDEAEDN